VAEAARPVDDLDAEAVEALRRDDLVRVAGGVVALPD
jgi:hypothetical protein